MRKVYFTDPVLRTFTVAFICVALISCFGNKGAKIKNPLLKVGQGNLSVPGGKNLVQRIRNWEGHTRCPASWWSRRIKLLFETI